MKKTQSKAKRFLSLFLALVMVLGVLPLNLFLASAAQEYNYPGGAGAVVVDFDTSGKYTESLGDNASTHYAGRIWTDKSVYANNVTFATYGGGQSTIALNQGGNRGEDFLIAYSALATSEAISGQSHAPVDVVLILDISGSMSNASSNMDNGMSRIYNAVQAANEAIDSLMAMNPYNRVAVVAFSSTAQTLLPLGRYTHDTETDWAYVPGQGYQQVTREVPFFELSRNTGSSNYADLTTTAIPSVGQRINRTVDVEGGTNIQVGLYHGMNLLASEQSVTAPVQGSQIKRTPSVVLLSDGAPTYSSDSSSWWAPANNDDHGTGSTAFPGNGFKAILTAAYMKDAIDRNYQVAGTASATTIYTVGMGITELSGSQKDLAYMTLNPGVYWNNAVTNDQKTAIKNYWSSYANSSSVSINVGQSSGWYDSDRYVTVTHPITGYDVDLNDGYNYVDAYYDADNASAVVDVFRQIVSNISISAPQVPTELKGGDPISDGYITYTDPIGEYMEVKDVKAIIYAGVTFTAKTVTKNGSVTTYVFEGQVHSEVYHDQDIKDIIITVTETDGKQTLVVKIPASVIPLRINEVHLNEDGTVATHTNNGAYPARIIYSVGMKSSVVKEDTNGNVYVDHSKISDAYLAANANPDGTINFYANLYRGDRTVHGYTVGEATVEFEPAHNNKFYYILEDMPIYKDEALTVQLTESEGIDPATVYYYKNESYHGNALEVEAVARTGAQLTTTSIVTGADGYLYRAAGSPRLNRILLFEGTKIQNATQTAQDFYAPTFVHADGNPDPYAGKFVIYQGNNGKLSLISGGILRITKTVTADDGLTAPDASFVFNIDLNGAEVDNGTFHTVITDADGSVVSEKTVSPSDHTVTLKHGQTATVYGLPPATTYTVTEAAANGFTQTISGASGVIAAGQTSVVSARNHYQVEPLLSPTNTHLTGKKVLVGRNWAAGDRFTFFISPYNNAPLPIGYDAALGVTVTSPDGGTGDTASFDFGNIRFTAPGVYRYTVFEKEPENHEYLPGMSYSRALYRLVVTIADNGDGTLSLVGNDLQKLYEDDGTPLFTYDSDNQIVLNPGQEGQDEIVFNNVYSASEVVRVPVAMKDYTDHSGEHPLISGMFEFKLEALGVVDAQGQVIAGSTSQAPMPSGSAVDPATGLVTILTSNEGHNISFTGVSFTQAAVIGGLPTTYRYRMSEVIPQNPVNGMVYDTTSYEVDVIVSIDPGSSTLVVDAVYPGQMSVATFRNTYTPVPVKADVLGNKTLIGRDMKSGESFLFTLQPSAETAEMVSQGFVVIPSAQATVTGGVNGQSVPFAFSDLEFKKAGVYTFYVSETAGTAGGMIYDNRVVTVTVTVHDSDNDGNLAATVSYSDGLSSADFTNRYESHFADTPVSLSGTKELVGKSLLEGEFWFLREDYKDGVKLGQHIFSHLADETPDVDGKYVASVNFLDGVSYTEAGNYEYRIYEHIPANPVGGTIYDTAVYVYTVIVYDDGEGALKIQSTSLTKNGAPVDPANLSSLFVFENVYQPAPTISRVPLIKKVISGDRADALRAGEYQFEITAASATPANGMLLPATTVVSNTADGSILFDPITFTRAGLYVVSIREIVPADSDKVPGITYSTQTIFAVFRVTDDRIGNLTATLVQFYGGDEFINLYKADPVEAELQIGKDLIGRVNDEWLATDAFSFRITPESATVQAIEEGAVEFTYDDPASQFATLTIDQKGEILSRKIKFNKPGTYTFTVQELNGGIAGVTYVPAVATLTFTVTDDSQTAKLAASITASVSGERADRIAVSGQNSDLLSVIFTNEYQSEQTAPVPFKARKIVTPSAGNSYTLGDSNFIFRITAPAGTPLPTTPTVGNAPDGTVDFGTVSFTERGTYVYTVREEQGSITGITYTTKIYTITVTVTDDYATGKLVASVAYASAGGDETEVLFENRYNPESTSATIFGKKTLNGGHKDIEAGEFEFTISTLTPFAPLPAMTVVTNLASGDFSFHPITFTSVGTYRYEIRETDLGKAGYRYDSNVFEVVVEVRDLGQGQLSATVSGLGDAQNPTVHFVNEYTPSSTEAELEISKNFIGRVNDEWLATDSFSFELSAANTLTAEAISRGEIVLPSLALTIQNKADVLSNKIRFLKAGEYVFTLKETQGTIAGVDYVDAVATVTFTVTEDRAAAKLVATVSSAITGLDADRITTAGENSAKLTFSFKNLYQPAATAPIGFDVKKEVRASAGNQFVLQGGEFSFSISAQGSAPMPAQTTATNDAQGAVDFGTIRFTERGTYVYTISEIQGTLGGITYTTEVYTVTVTVADDYAAGNLTATVSYVGTNGTESSATFTNTYDPKDTQTTIIGIKTLDGGHKDLEANEFEFAIRAITSGAPLPAQLTVRNDGQGKFSFAPITFTSVGTYRYEISETALNEKGYTYDTRTYEVLVEVKDRQGELYTVVTGVGTQQNPTIQFVNSYKPDSTDLTLGLNGELKKVLDGRELKPEEFIFALLDSTGTEIKSVKNAAGGTFRFDLTFTKAGIYTYTITEKLNNVAGITYDTRTYGVKIVIVDKGGYLEAESVTYTLAGNPVNTVEFKNSYKPTKAEISVVGVKKLVGRDLQNGEFEFVLKDAEGKIVSTATNTAQGKILFDKIEVTKAGTFTYTVYEKSGTAEFVTYDKTEFVVEFVVTDDTANGKLVVSAPVIKNAANNGAVSEVVFENTYRVPTPPQTADGSNLMLWLALVALAGLGLTAIRFCDRKIRLAK